MFCVFCVGFECFVYFVEVLSVFVYFVEVLSVLCILWRF